MTDKNTCPYCSPLALSQRQYAWTVLRHRPGKAPRVPCPEHDAPRPPRPAPPAAMRADSNEHRCPYYGKDVPHEFDGCLDCRVASKCYDEWERAAQGAREAA